MLDLDARIDLDEVEVAAVGVEQELGGAGVVEADGPADREAGVQDAPADRGVEIRGRGDFHDLLMAALKRTVALVEVDEVAVLIADELDFNVARPRQEFFQEDIRDAKRGAGLAAGLVERFVERIRGERDAHAATAAAHRGLDDHRIAELGGELAGLGIGLDGRVAAGQHRHAGLLGDVPGRHLVAELFENFRARSDEDDAGLGTRPREVRVLREEAVAGVDRIDLMLLRQRDDAVDVEIGADRFAGLADAVRLIGLEAVQRKPVLMREDGDRADAQFVRRAEDANSDLAAVGNEQLANGRDGRFLRHVR